jgi:hypothetical protein
MTMKQIGFAMDPPSSAIRSSYALEGQRGKVRVPAQTVNVVNLSDRPGPDYAPRVDGARVVWHSMTGGASEIFLYENGRTRQLTDQGIPRVTPRISGDRIVFSGTGPIWLWENGTITEIGEPGTLGRSPDIDGNLVVWTGGEPFGSQDVFVHDGRTRTRIDDGGVAASSAAVSGKTVVFQGASSASRITDVYVALPFRFVRADGR